MKKKTLSVNTEAKYLLEQTMKIGIVKQLYHDQLITAQQYQYLLIKYGYDGNDGYAG